MELSRSRKALLRRLQVPRQRAREGAVVAEGPRVVAEGLRAGLRPRFLLLSEGDPGSDGAGPRDPSTTVESLTGLRTESHVAVVDPAAFAEFSGTESPQGLLGVFDEPEAVGPEAGLEGIDRILVLDRVQDPGNVGTLCRSAWAFGIDLVIALSGTADPWGGKAVRAAAGGTFHLRVGRGEWASWQEVIAAARIPVLVAAADGDQVDRARPADRFVLIVGNEVAGVAPELRVGSGAVVSLPMAAGVDSLNVAVAGSILLYSLTEPRSIERVPSGSGEPG